MVTVYRLVLIPRRRDEERRHRLVQRFARLFRPENFVAFSRFEVHFQLRQRVYHVFYIFISSFRRRRRREIKDALDALGKPFQRSFRQIRFCSRVLLLFVARIHFLYLFFQCCSIFKNSPLLRFYPFSIVFSRSNILIIKSLLLKCRCCCCYSFLLESCSSLSLFRRRRRRSVL